MTVRIVLPSLGYYSTKELLDELEARNVGGQRHHHDNPMMRCSDLLSKLRLNFSLRSGGLDYRAVD